MEPALIDYSKIVLTEEEQTLFDRFRESDTATLTRKEYHILCGKKLILPEMDGENPWHSDDIQSGTCKLSQKGKELRVYQGGMRKAEAKAEERYQQGQAKAEERYREEQAKAEARDRRNYRIAVATLVVSILTLIAALCRAS